MAITKVTSGLISADAASVDLNIDAGTLYIDATNNRVGIANTSPSAALDITGNIVVSGTVDGRDLATDGTKLDGIEANATADQTQAEINALGITATGLSGTPNITVGTISSGQITSTSSVFATQLKSTSQVGQIWEAPAIHGSNTAKHEMRSRWDGDNDRWFLVPYPQGSADFTKEIIYDFGTSQWALEGSPSIAASGLHGTPDITVGTISSGLVDAVVSNDVVGLAVSTLGDGGGASNTGLAILPYSSGGILRTVGTNRNMLLQIGTSTALTLDSSLNATFAGTISSGHITVNTSTLKTTDSAIGLFTTDLTVGNNVAQQSTATPKRIFFNNDYSSGYTDASLKIYLFNDDTTRAGLTSGPAFDMQYHMSGSSSGRHAFYIQNVEKARIDNGGIDIKSGGLDINGTAVIDSSRNLTNIGTISSGELSVTTGQTASGTRTPFYALHTNQNTIQITQFGQSHANAPAVNQIGVSNAEQHLHLVTDTSANVAAGTSTKGIFLRSGGNVGIGTNDPSGSLHILNSSGGQTPLSYLNIQGATANNSNYPGVVFTGGSLANVYPYISLSNGGLALSLFAGRHTTNYNNAASMTLQGSTGDIIFFTNSGSSSGVEKMRLQSNGYLNVKDGILFGSDSAAANALDDYEEGTFTPVVGNGTYTYSYRRGHYVKIGNLVHIHIGFKLNTASPGTSVANISGLPFTSANLGSYQEPHVRVGVAGLCATANLSYNLSFFVGNNSTALFARSSASNADTTVLSNALWQNGTFIKLQMIYTVS